MRLRWASHRLLAFVRSLCSLLWSDVGDLLLGLELQGRIDLSSKVLTAGEISASCIRDKVTCKSFISWRVLNRLPLSPRMRDNFSGSPGTRPSAFCGVCFGRDAFAIGGTRVRAKSVSVDVPWKGCLEDDPGIAMTCENNVLISFSSSESSAMSQAKLC